MNCLFAVLCTLLSLATLGCGKSARPGNAEQETAADDSVATDPADDVHVVGTDVACQGGPDNSQLGPCPSSDAGATGEDASRAVGDAGRDARVSALDAEVTPDGSATESDAGCQGGDAEPSLFGTIVTMTVAYPTLASPISNVMTAMAGPGIEFRDIQSQATSWPVVAADVDLEARRIVFRYKGTGPFGAVSTGFNGYIFTLAGPTRAIVRADIDVATSPELRGARVMVEAGRMTINVEGLGVTPTSVLALSLGFAECGAQPSLDAGQVADAGAPADGGPSRAQSDGAASDAGQARDGCMGEAAATGLLGSAVTMTVAYATPATPISNAVTAVVGAGAEFGSIERLALPGFRVGAADLDVEAQRIVFRYKEALTFPAPSGGFNGYVFTGLGQGIVRAEVDSTTSLELRAATVILEPGRLTINVQGLSITPTSVLSVSLSFAACSGVP